MFDPTSLVGIHTLLSLLALGTGVLAVLALFGLRLAPLLDGFWRVVYAGGMVASLYFLVLVAVAQAFAKVPVLKAAAPTLSETPFAISQGIVVMIFLGLGIAALKLFRRAAPATI